MKRLQWRPLPEGDGPLIDLARGLRAVIDDYVAQTPGMSRAADFAEAVPISPSSLSGAVSGRGVPTAQVVEAIVALAVGRDAIPEFEERRKAADEQRGEKSDAGITLIGSAAVEWDTPGEQEPDYRDFNRLFPEDKLLDAYSIARRGGLAEESDVVWVFLVVSAVQHGAYYWQWYLMAKDHEIAVIEGLVEVMLRTHTRPRWRAAWLLQQISDLLLKTAALNLARDLPAATVPEADPLRALIAAVEANQVESHVKVSQDPKLRPELRTAILSEFVGQQSRNVARGALSAYLQAPGASLLAAEAQDFIGRERLGAYRDFYFVANRLSSTLSGDHPGDRDETTASIVEGLRNRSADIQRITSPSSRVRAAAQNVMTQLLAWAKETNSEMTTRDDQARRAHEVEELLNEFNEAGAAEIVS